ncbi:MAG: fatty acid desaturase [Gammaproteobacteria bacterium]|nr:MAG: fatty acid desaturase [Gammaproteobacteria bacterium]TLZ54568.1 MAG: fatty acid desaturase [Gammaproteobacteria bacterium]TLZ62324.1 MAG: fatty acid desaturase [Gammaproteobacteria bacterium]
MTPVDELAVTTPDASAALAARAEPQASVEMPTLGVALLVYGGWLAVTLAYGRWPLIIVAPLAAVLVTLHGSLQHEIVHGHPTRWRGINRLLAIVPLSLYLPYERYRVSHLIHHNDERLTDPLDDPESYYFTPEDWARLSPLTRLAVRLQQTLAGRVTIGALWAIGRFWHQEWRAILRNDEGVRATWLEHLAWCIPVILWVKVVCGMPVSLYFFAVAVPATSLTLIRSFAEHRARPEVRQRIAIVEGSWILGPLYLFNNLHALHHEVPSVPWYQLPGHYRAERARLVVENGGLVYRTYFDVARRYLFRAHDEPQHPSGRVPVRAG